ncbi:hypothetical protein [Sphingobium aromaticiconvertens]|uniref:hypothetical protein n=1 Tax=Sphingobium aromaticiconvertens TaxID=365341 RepID=UPI00301A223C
MTRTSGAIGGSSLGGVSLTSRYGARPGTDIAAALQDALLDTTTPQIIIPGGNYDASKLLLTERVRKHVIAAPDAKFRWIGDDSMIQLNPGPEWVEDVLAITQETAPLGDGASGNTTYSVLTLANDRQVEPGSVYKIVSDDPLDNVLEAGNPLLRRRKGENVFVGAASSGATVKLTGVLLDTYATGMKLLKYRPPSFSWTGGSFDFDPAAISAAPSTSAIFKLLNMHAPQLDNVDVLGGKLPFVYFGGCFGPSLDNARFSDIRTDPAIGQFGYGINNVSSEGGSFTRLIGHNLRHLKTDNCHYTQAGDGLHERRGRPRGNRVDGLYARGCTNAPADTHETGDGTFYTGVRTGGTFAGPSSGGAAYNARGNTVEFTDCHSLGDYKGFQLSVVDGCLIENSTVKDAWLRALQIDMPDSAIFSRNIRLRNSIFGTRGPNAPARFGDSNLNGYQAEIVEASNLTFKLSANANTTSLLEFGGARVRGRNWTLDLRDYVATSSAGAVTLFQFLTSNNDVEIDGVTIIAPLDTSAFATAWASIAGASAAGNTSRLVLRNVTVVADKDFVGASIPNGNIFGVHANLTGDVMLSGEKVISATRTATDFMDTTSAAPSIAKVADKLITIRSGSSAATAVTVAVTGKPDGHRFRYVNSGAGEKTVNGIAIAQDQAREWVVRGGVALAA